MYTVASPGGDEKPVVLLDPNKLSEDGTVRERRVFLSFFLFFFFLLLLLPPPLPFTLSIQSIKILATNTRSPWEARASATTAN